MTASSSLHNEPNKRPASRKHRLFYIIAILLPFAFLLLLEFALRLFGYGNSYPLFVPAPQKKEYLQPNPDLIKRYFPAHIKAPAVSPDTTLFKKQKSPNTLRIVTMGGSTMAGFPYGRFGSPAGMLKQRIKATNPDQNVEIISVALSSVNSYTLLDITDEVIAINPDAVLIYTGHNEYLGVMGVGSVYASKGGHAANLLFLKLKEWRLLQLVQHLYYALFTSDKAVTENADASSQDEQRTVMAKVAKNKNIVFGNATYQAGVAQFESNLALILKKLNQADVPTFIANLVANERDQAPFASVANVDIENAMRVNRQNLTTIETAKNLKHADYFYWLAQQTQSANKHQVAHDYYQVAADFDVLRFRAPSEFNRIIADQAQQHKAILVDVYGDLHAYSKEGIIGFELMLEHLHPNSRGYFLIAESFYKALQSAQFLSPQYAINQDQAWQLSPLHDVDLGFAAHKIERLMADYPFTDTPKHVPLPAVNTELDTITLARIKGKPWMAVQQDLLAYYQGNNQFERAANVAGILFDALPDRADLARIASMLYLRAQVLPMAKYYANHAVSLRPEDVNYRLTLAEITFKLGDTTGAIDQINRVLSIDPNNAIAKQIKQQLNQ